MSTISVLRITSITLQLLLLGCENQKQGEVRIGEIGYTNINSKDIDTSTVYLNLKKDDTLSFWTLTQFIHQSDLEPSINYIIEVSCNNELVETFKIDALKFDTISYENRHSHNGKSNLEFEGRNHSYPILSTGEYKLFCTFKFDNEEEFNLERLQLYFTRSPR